jgi:deazaflavin-dependent oxidoreductase (nitroreductase family)
MNVEQQLTDIGVKAMNLIHHTLLTLTGGRLGHNVFGMQAVELHTTGRKSGQRRSVMLTSPVYEPDRIVLVASKGGDDRQPDWYRNLVDDPNVEVTVRGTTRPMRARTASADEKAALWPAIVKAYPGYGSYQKRTERDIPVVIVEPRAD